MSAKTDFDDLFIFAEHENEVIEFESTWNLKREYAKAIPIPTQTDPTNKSVDKATNSQEAKHMAVQTEPFLVAKGSAVVNEKKLIDSLRTLSALMEAEIKLGTTNVFKFQSN